MEKTGNQIHVLSVVVYAERLSATKKVVLAQIATKLNVLKFNVALSNIFRWGNAVLFVQVLIYRDLSQGVLKSDSQTNS
jgi:hypothetical protein